ncbi:uncharacterized protein B0P05DRAFT_537149 [Gilbertella persicaria]|uniref:uncharacterized protein n=1 Tax=Gilbertella persicaria TaxID=101096 RepID=UPI002220EE70|nr:uncharacterized protein B0P05DRAFT_537149 [Gilbertella persicaria]KAI8083400.1 hypothetical protein B0P05DRAFT_537149 [Gilbertella persicaria]
MPSTSNTLDRLANISECSISGLFQELWQKNNHSSEPLQFGDIEGSDFKRLVHKHKHLQDNEQELENKTKYHQSSPDFRPIVYLERKPISSPRLGNTIYNFLFQHEDRYFNNDRDELSKDIFPVGYQQA